MHPMDALERLEKMVGSGSSLTVVEDLQRVLADYRRLLSGRGNSFPEGAEVRMKGRLGLADQGYEISGHSPDGEFLRLSLRGRVVGWVGVGIQEIPHTVVDFKSIPLEFVRRHTGAFDLVKAPPVRADVAYAGMCPEMSFHMKGYEQGYLDGRRGPVLEFIRALDLPESVVREIDRKIKEKKNRSE